MKQRNTKTKEYQNKGIPNNKGIPTKEYQQRNTNKGIPIVGILKTIKNENPNNIEIYVLSSSTSQSNVSK